LIIGEVNKDIAMGIGKVQSLLKEHRLFIIDNCRNLLDELAQYRYDVPKDQREGKELPIKVNDHLCDCLRYGIVGNELGQSFTYQEEKAEKERITENRRAKSDFELL
jgi:hypothetical protein